MLDLIESGNYTMLGMIRLASNRGYLLPFGSALHR
jgi:hypothetical protein